MTEGERGLPDQEGGLEAALAVISGHPAFRLHPLPTWVVDLKDLRFLAVNEAALRQYGCSRGEFLARRITAIPPSEDLPRLLEFLAADTGDSIATTEWRHCLKDGRLIDVRVTVRRLTLCGHRVGLIAGTDITERKRVEGALQNSEANFHAISEAVPLALAITRLEDGTILHANSKLAEIMRIPLRDLIGRRTTEFYGDIDERRKVLALLAQQGGTLSNFEIQARRADGTPWWLILHGRIIDYHGEPAFLGAGIDITERKAAEDQLRAAKRAAELATLGKSRFFAAASHDLRQPLAALSLFVGVLQSEIASARGREVLRAIQQSVQAINSLVEGHLDIARIDAGLLRIEPVNFAIAPLISRLTTEFAPQLVNKGLSFRVHGSTDRVRSEPEQLARILRNLLSNAVRYTVRGGVLLGCRPRGRFLRIEVWDTGPGIPENQRQAIFEEFYQIDEGGRSSGTKGLGLGLSIVERLARLLGHAIDVRSTPGRGAMFAVTVPLAEPEAEADAPADEEAKEAEPVIAGTHVLLIEDDGMVLQGLESLLTHWGCVVVAATSLDLALKAVRHRPFRPELVIADFQLAEPVTGIEAIRQVSAQVGARLRGIIMTGDTDPSRLRLTKESGFRLLHKPVLPATLRRVIAQCLRRAP